MSRVDFMALLLVACVAVSTVQSVPLPADPLVGLTLDTSVDIVGRCSAYWQHARNMIYYQVNRELEPQQWIDLLVKQVETRKEGDKGLTAEQVNILNDIKQCAQIDYSQQADYYDQQQYYGGGGMDMLDTMMLVDAFEE